MVTILIVPQREQFLFEYNSSGLVFDMLELEDIPGRDFKASIRTLFGKIIHFNCPLKLFKNFISFRELIYFSKQKMFFTEIFEITNWKFKDSPEILKSTLYIYENTLNVWNFRDAPHPQHPWTARHRYYKLVYSKGEWISKSLIELTKYICIIVFKEWISFRFMLLISQELPKIRSRLSFKFKFINLHLDITVISSITKAIVSLSKLLYFMLFQF